MGFREMRVEFANGGLQAPGMVLVEPVRELWRDAWRGHMRLTQDVDEHTVLMTKDDAERYLTPAQLHEMQKGWVVTVTVDPWEAANWLGYDGQTLCEDLEYQNRCVALGRDRDWTPA